MATRWSLACALALAACHGGSDASSTSGSGAPPAVLTQPDAAIAIAPPAPAPAKAPVDQAPSAGHDFIAEAQKLFRVAACSDGPVPEGLDAAIVERNCTQIRAIQTAYRDRWLTKAAAWFSTHVPANVPKKVVYPFAGGDLSTALTVYPDADEITTISLEPAGDARSIDDLTRGELAAALDEQRKELKFLYTVDFSNTLDLIDSMREGRLPGQLVFSLNALRVHGLEPVSLHYFHLEPDGSIKYLTDDEIAAAGDPRTVDPSDRNYKFSNMELRFGAPGDARVRIYRHIRWNLDNKHLEDGKLIKHLAAKGPVAGMTKAASYLLSWPTFSTMRTYLLQHVVWMVSDATGIPPDVAGPAGFTQETYGMFDGPHIPAGNSATKAWVDLWRSEPVRELPFRFGYPDKHKHRHLVITHKTA
jgi:hypothetical protein